MKNILIIFIAVTLTLTVLRFSLAQEDVIRVLPIEEFIVLATEKDTVFQEILINELKLKYKKAIVLPPGDVVLDLRSQYSFLFDPSKSDSENAVSLSKLFPFIGTDVGVGYSSSLNTSSRAISSEISAQISQPIAENAFGRNTRLLDEITGLEIDVATYQIVEAYESYLAILIQTYYNWYSSYKDLETAKHSYTENKKLLQNIKEREKHKIALPVDVNKISLQVLDKQESVITLQNRYTDNTNLIKKSIRYQGTRVLQPQRSDRYADVEIDFKHDYEVFYKQSRTSKILRLLEDKTSLEVDRDADELLPSIDLFVSYSQDGEGRSLKNSDKTVYTGISVDWPIPDQVGRAQYQTARIEHDKAILHSEDVHIRLYTKLKNLNDQINKEKKLIDSSEEKIELAQAIVDDDTKNYSLGRISLNDLISEINILENSKFSRVYHEVELRKMVVEWLNVTDKLVKKDQVIKE